MSLSNFLKNINDSPRSTKVALGIAAAASAMAVLAACGGGGPSAPDPTPTAKVVYVYATPEHTPSPVPTSAPAPAPTPEAQPVVEEPTPLPTETPLPTATPTPDVNDFFVVLHQGKVLNNDVGVVAFYASYPFRDYRLEGNEYEFHNEEFYLEYLRKERVITSEQKDAYFNGEPIQKIPLVSISTATYKLFENDPFNASKLSLRVPEYLTHYADKSSLDSSETATSLPVATPTPEVNDYFVVLHQGDDRNNGIGVIEYYASYPFHKDTRGSIGTFYEEDFYLEYLWKEGVITSEQKNAYFKGEPIQKIPLVPISTATYKLFETDPYNASKLRFETSIAYLFHYADKSSLDSNENVLGGKISLDGSEGYVTISDGKISVSAVDDDGNTTTVNVEGVSAKELLDYWLSQNKITIEQKNQYGKTGEIQFSLKDGADLLDFDYSSDGGASIGLDKDVQNKIVNEILPLFSSD